MKRACQEIRALAVKGVQSGQYTVQQMADLTEYTAASIYNWIRVSREEDRLTAKPGGHRAPAFSADEQEQLRELLKQQPSITLEEIREHFQKSCSVVAVYKTLRRMGITFKKNIKGE